MRKRNTLLIAALMMAVTMSVSGVAFAAQTVTPGKGNPDTNPQGKCVKHQERMRDVLAAGWEQGDKQRRKKFLYGALWMALEFQTWHTLARQQGFANDEMVELMVGMVRCLMLD